MKAEYSQGNERWVRTAVTRCSFIVAIVYFVVRLDSLFLFSMSLTRAYTLSQVYI